MIWVECYPDKVLLDVLGYEARHPRGGGKSRVIWRASKGGLGLVDLDHEGSTPSACVRDEERSRPDSGVWVFRCGSGWVVALEKNLEGFLVAAAREAGIRLEDYGLSSDPKRLHGQISKVHPPPEYKRCLEELLRRRSERFRILAEVLRNLTGG